MNAQTFGADERQAPSERINEIREPIRMRTGVELSDCDVLIRVFEYCTTIVIDITVIWSRKNSDDRRKLLRRCLALHVVTMVLSFVTANDAQQVVAL